MFNRICRNARFWLAALALATGFTGLAAAFPMNVENGGNPTSRSVQVNTSTPSLFVQIYSSDANYVWPTSGQTILWTAISTSGLAGPNTYFGNPCVAGTGGTSYPGSNYAQSSCTVRSDYRPGTYTVTASVPSQPSIATLTYTITVVGPQQAPTIDTASPSTVPLSGGSVTLNGTHFIPGTTVTIGGLNAPVTSTRGDYGQITVTAPANTSGGKNVVVNNGTASATLSNGVTYLSPPPTISSISPNSGPTTGGTSVTITGTNLNAATGVTIGGNALTSLVAVSATTVTGVTPAGTAGAKDVVVTTPGGPTTLTNGFTYVAVPTLAINDVTTAEGNSGTSTQTFTVSLSAPAPAGGVTFDIATANGSATTSDGDYVGRSLTSQTIPAGASTYSFAVNINGDTKFEANETFFVNVTNVTGATVSDGQGQGTITNDDAAPTISINDVTLNEGNSGTTSFTFTVSLSAPTGVNAAVNYATANNTATQPSDYTSASGTLTFVAGGSTALTVTVQVNGDTAIEPNETFFVNLTGAINATIADNQGVGTILNDDVAVDITTASLPGGQAGASYAQTISTTGGLAPIGFAVTSGSLPPGVTLGLSTGALSGTPNAVGSFTFEVTATDSNTPQTSDTQSYTVNITPPDIALGPAGLANGQIGVTYSQTVSASGGTGAYGYAVTAGALPLGLTLAPSNGVISGTPVQAGSFNFTITASDQTAGPGAPYTGSRVYTMNVLSPALSLTPATLAGMTVGQSYTQQITAGGGTLPFSYAMYGGTVLPSGLSLSSSGLITGTPTGSGSFNFTIAATDSSTGSGAPFTVARAYNVTVAAPTITLSPASGALPGAAAGVAYTQQLTAGGGTAPYVYSVVVNTLPAGLTLNPTSGVISGTPTTTGTFNFTVQAADSSTGSGAPFSVVQVYSITVSAPTITIAPATLPDGAQFSPYSQAITATGGTAPYGYTVATGGLPDGITLATDGTLSGTPTVFGSFPFTVTATDQTAGGTYSGSRSYTLVIAQTPPTVTSVTPNSGPTAGGQSVTVTGTNFYNVTSVTFGGTVATVTASTPTALTVTTPAHAEGAVDVVVTAGGGTATATNGYTFVAPGTVRFAVNNPDDGAYVFSSPTTALNFTINTSGGAGQSANISLPPGSYTLSFTTPNGTGLAAASCMPSSSSVNTASQTASLAIVSNVTTICTIEAVPSRRVTVETLGVALQTQSTLIINNAPSLARRLGRLNGSATVEGSASAFGKTFASGLPFSADIGADQIRFSASLSGIRRLANESHTFAAANENGVPTSLSASATPASGLAATAAADATAAVTNRAGPRFDIWVEGLLAEFDAAANSEGHFAIVHAGADYLVADNLLVGVGIQGDWLDMNTASGSVNVSGWLAGPYATARLSERLYLDARIAWGGASFEVSPFGTYTDTVTSDRTLYSAALIGEFEMGNLTIRPEGRVTWYKETTEAYVDSLNIFIPEVEIKTGEVSFGPDFEWTLPQENGGVFLPKIGFDLIWTFQQDNTATSFTGAPGLDETGVRGRIEVGAAYIDPRGVEIGGGLFYDGIGGGDYSAWGGTLKIRFGF